KGLSTALREAYRLLGSENANQPDLKIVTGEPAIGIDAVKELILYLSRKPYQSNVVVGIIHPGETLTSEAGNSLLKILEEPPEFAHLFITTTHLSALLPTIRSRCQTMTLDEALENNTTPVAVADLINLPLSKKLKKIELLLKDKTVTSQ